MNTLKVLQDLVTIPSFVDDTHNEHDLGNYIFDYLNDKTTFHVEKQLVEGNRFNIIAHDNHPPKLLFCCHMDTVPYSGNWTYKPLQATIDGDHVFGLGTSDMKGGIACLLSAIAQVKNTRGLWLLFDVDEEYYFKGMKKFLDNYSLQPQLAVFTEPGFKIQNGHRGLIEVHFQVRGITGHASRPSTGKNAIMGAVTLIQGLISELSKYNDAVLGDTTCNLAYLKGGIEIDKDDIGNTIIDIQPNKIPDIAEIILDIRPASKSVRAGSIINTLNDLGAANGLVIEGFHPKLDYGSLLIPKGHLTKVEKIIESVLGKVEYADIQSYGYGEAQMLNEKLGTDCIYFGPGPDTSHQVDEHVSLSEMEKTSIIYRKIIDVYCR